MRKKYLLFIVLILLSCKSKIAFTTKERIDLVKYKNLPLHPGVLDNPNSKTHVYLYQDKEMIIYEDDEIISIQENTLNSPFTSQKLYSKKTLLLKRDEMQFYDFCINTTKIFDDNGLLIKSIDCDEKYRFSIDQLIEKMKKEYGLDFSKRAGGIQRNVINGKWCYILLIGPGGKGGYKKIIIDGTTGNIISESNHKYNEENDPNVKKGL